MDFISHSDGNLRRVLDGNKNQQTHKDSHIRAHTFIVHTFYMLRAERRCFDTELISFPGNIRSEQSEGKVPKGRAQKSVRQR